jgi:hypothetical protein
MKRAAHESRRRADLLSVSGAALAGAAVGVWWARTLAPLAPALFAIGLAVHAIGMTVRHRLDRRNDGPLPRGWQVLYIVCWILIALVVVAAGVLAVGARG